MLKPLASILFFLSGATSLAYQVIWFREFAQIWGSTSLATAAVVASFLGGLGLGAERCGRLADRLRRPLSAYGLFEIGIGLLALLVPLELVWIREASAYLYSWMHEWPVPLTLSRLLLSFLILGPPCFLMGGTLPFLTRDFVGRGLGVGPAVAWLYALNTLGAAIGCYLTGFHLLPWLGLDRWNLSVAMLNLAIGVVALVVGRRPSGVPGETDDDPSNNDTDANSAPSPTSVARPVPRARVVLLAAFLTGAGAIALEVVWARQLSVILGGSTYAFTAMLFVVLLGIGVGSLLYQRQLSGPGHIEWRIIAAVLGILITTVLGKIAIPALTYTVGEVGTLRSDALYNGLLCAGASAVLQFFPALGMGVLFPLLIQATCSPRTDAGRTTGRLYGWNTVGAILGGVLASVFGIPLLGTTWSVTAALGLYTIALLLLLPAPNGWRATATFFAVCVVAGAAVFLSASKDDPRVTNWGMYLYGAPDAATLEADVLHFAEGRTANVLVLSRAGFRSLRVNGKVDASDVGDMPMQAGSAYFPFFLAPDDRSALVIGFGSGTTAGGLLLFPEVDVVCCEIEPEVVAAAEHFSAVNHRPQVSPRFQVVYDDARTYLQGTDRHFDWIVSEPSNPWIAGVGALFTREYYEIVKARLAPGGMLAQWIQAYSFSRESYALVVRTVLSVFDHACLVRISDGDTILLAWPEAPDLSAATIDRAQGWVDAIPEVERDLRTYFGTRSVRELLLSHVILGTESLRRIADTVDGVHTDRNLRLEFQAPLTLFSRFRGDENVPRFVLGHGDLAWFQRHAESWALSAADARAFHKLAFLFDKDGQSELVRGLIDIGLSLDAENVELIADSLITADAVDGLFSERLQQLVRASPTETLRVAVACFGDGERQRSATVLEALVEANPGSATAWSNLALVRARLGDEAGAAAALERSVALDPMHDNVLKAQKQLRRLGDPGKTPAAEDRRTPAGGSDGAAKGTVESP